MACRFLSRRVVVALFALLWCANPAQSDVRYIYDALGRLIAVIDTGGDTATYSYDAVGNLLAIDRFATTTVAVIAFTPATGPVGTTVTISGTGFSATPASNTVTFNGTGATVSSASTTQLVVTVPSGATTGVISVTAPAGSDSSSSSFSVAAPPTPTITSFSPTVGVAGASVTVTGTNFQTTALNNRLQFNVTGVAPTSSTSTSISTTVPTHTASGKIKVTTPFGQDVSDDDFFVAPSPFVASDVFVTNRMGFNQSTGLAISTANKIGLMVFDATHGQRVSLKMVTGPQSVIKVYGPNAGTLASTTRFSNSTGLIEPLTLSLTGTYTVLVDPSGTGTGTVTLTAYDVVDTTGTITAGGSAVNVTTTTPGQNGLLTFSGTSGQRISLKVNSGAPFGTADVLNPDGSGIGSAGMSSFTGFMDVKTLTSTGTHTVKVDPDSTNTGTAVLTLYDVPADESGTLTINGGAASPTITTAGQNGTYTFSGTASQTVTVRVTSNTMGVTVKLLRPDGTTMTQSITGSANFNLAQQTLPTTGTYSVVIDPSSMQTGSLNVAVTDP